MKNRLKQSVAALLLLCLASCVTERKCLQKFGNVLTDTVTVHQTVKLTVPRDSAVLRITTDTTVVVKEVHQGRATVRIVREPHYTYVTAECDSAQLAKDILIKYPRNTIKMGVATWYKYGFWVLVVLAIATYLSYQVFTRFNFNIERK